MSLTKAESDIVNKAEALCKEAIAASFSAEEALALITMGAIAPVCLIRIRRGIEERKKLRQPDGQTQMPV